jgi:hypothetical protein
MRPYSNKTKTQTPKSQAALAAAAPLSPTTPQHSLLRPVVLCHASTNNNHQNNHNDDDDPGYSFHSGPGYDEETRSYGILRARIALLRAREVEEARAAERAAAREAAARQAEHQAAASRPPLPQVSEGVQTWDEVMADADLLARWHENAWSAVRDAHLPTAGLGAGGGGGGAPAAAGGGPSSPASAMSSFDFGDEAFY